MADTLLDIYGNYNRALQRYTQEANKYNTAGKAWEQSVKDYNASVISDKGAYNKEGNYAGGGPYTTYNGFTVGRTGAPINTYQTDPTGYNTSFTNAFGESVNPEQAYDLYGNLVEGVNKSVTPIYSGTNEITYVDPTTGLASVYAARPASEFTMEMPTAPIEPMGNPPNTMLGNIDQTQLYQSLFGKGTPDILSNEAWSLQNIGTPFLSTETSAYETGGVNRMNNPMYYAQPNLLTTGQAGVDINSSISGQQVGNLYY